MTKKLLFIALIIMCLWPAALWAGRVSTTDFAGIERGMSPGEVEHRLGPPDRVYGTPWVSFWEYLPEPGDHQAIFSVIEFWNGRVHDKRRHYR